MKNETYKLFRLSSLEKEKVLLYVVHDDTHEAFEDTTKSLLCYLFTYYGVCSFKQFLS